MSLEDQEDGVREINPVVFFPAGQPMGVYENPNQPEEKAVPKGSSAPESASSSPTQVEPVKMQQVPQSPSTPAPPAPPPAGKDNGQPKENESSTPTG